MLRRYANTVEDSRGYIGDRGRRTVKCERDRCYSEASRPAAPSRFRQSSQHLPWASVDCSRTGGKPNRCHGRRRSPRMSGRTRRAPSSDRESRRPASLRNAPVLCSPARVARTTPMKSQLPFTTTGRCGIPTWRYLETGSSVDGVKRFANSSSTTAPLTDGAAGCVCLPARTLPAAATIHCCKWHGLNRCGACLNSDRSASCHAVNCMYSL